MCSARIPAAYIHSTAALRARSPWDVLGVKPGTDKKALKTQYRKLAMQYHPDRNPGDPGGSTIQRCHQLNLSAVQRQRNSRRSAKRTRPWRMEEVQASAGAVAAGDSSNNLGASVTEVAVQKLLSFEGCFRYRRSAFHQPGRGANVSGILSRCSVCSVEQRDHGWYGRYGRYGWPSRVPAARLSAAGQNTEPGV